MRLDLWVVSSSPRWVWRLLTNKIFFFKKVKLEQEVYKKTCAIEWVMIQDNNHFVRVFSTLVTVLNVIFKKQSFVSCYS